MKKLPNFTRKEFYEQYVLFDLDIFSFLPFAQETNLHEFLKFSLKKLKNIPNFPTLSASFHSVYLFHLTHLVLKFLKFSPC